jgi:cobalamin-dependent methionine synthase I
MLIIGERINATRKHIAEAISKQDTAFIQAEAKKQLEAGADWLDVNSGTKPGLEKSNMEWLVKTIRAVTDKPLCVDSSSPEAIEAGHALHGPGKALVNSVTDEPDRIEKVLPLVKKSGSAVVALLIDSAGVPETVERKLAIAKSLVPKVTGAGIPMEDIYVDPCVFPASTDTKNGLILVDSIHAIRKLFPGIKFTLGLSNISYGLPKRSLVNQSFLTMLLCAGLESALIDPLDAGMMSTLRASEALLNKDEYCLNYINYTRGQKE